MDPRRSHVMNDDVLGLIFNELSVKQLLRLESVCNQFMDCIGGVDTNIGSALQRKNELRIGSNWGIHPMCKDKDITDAIVCNGNKYDLIESKDTFELILGKCLNIKCLYIKSLHLTNTSIDGHIISLITTRCPQLKRLYLDNIVIKAFNKEEVMNTLKPLLSQLSHLTLRGIFNENIVQLLPQLSSLESIALNYLYGYYADSAQVVEMLPQNIRVLNTKMINSKTAMDTLVKRCPHLVSLTMDEQRVEDVDHMFAKICTHFKLKRFDYHYWEEPMMSADVFAQYIPKLSELTHLSLSAIDLNGKVMKPMPSVKYLCLQLDDFYPKMVHKFTQIYPNVKRLRLDLIGIICECNVDHVDYVDTDDDPVYNPCPNCVHNCMYSVSQFTQLKRLYIIFDSDYLSVIGSNDMKLFSELNVLSLEDYKDINSLIEFVFHCIEYRVSKKYLKLELDPIIKASLIKRLNDMKVTIPKNIIIKSNECH